ncbi:hypothetical protein [Clostridioides sp. ZZV15-6597]|uniref:hypothetical protein n=1 Tax=Clostridioides sp. ZZV15-6597 TaxID=2811500 RepID=UPI001D119462|nr:hypothetical protein [Clostridioides sp. ZZV15-6597]
MIKIEAKKGKKIIKKEIKVEYIDFNVSENGERIKESVNALRLKQLHLDNNIEWLYFINKSGDRLELLIERIYSLSYMNSTVCVTAFCPDLFVVYKKNILKEINKTKVKISPILIYFEDAKKIIKLQKFLFPRYWTNYMKIIWFQNNNYPIHSSNIKVKCRRNTVIFKYYIEKSNFKG